MLRVLFRILLGEERLISVIATIISAMVPSGSYLLLGEPGATI